MSAVRLVAEEAQCWDCLWWLDRDKTETCSMFYATVLRKKIETTQWEHLVIGNLICVC